MLGVAAALTGGCLVARTYECVDISLADCDAAAMVAASAVVNEGPWVVLTVDRLLASDCTRVLPGGGESHRDPCLPEGHDLVTEVTMRSEDGRVEAVMVVRDEPGERMRLAGPAF